jgi:hypothetical protein
LAAFGQEKAWFVDPVGTYMAPGFGGVIASRSRKDVIGEKWEYNYEAVTRDTKRLGHRSKDLNKQD